MLIRRVEAVLTAILMLVMPVLLTGCGAETKSNHVVYYMNNSGISWLKNTLILMKIYHNMIWQMNLYV